MVVLYFRLCDLNTLCNKRGHRNSSESSSAPSKKRKILSKNKDNSSDSLDDPSTSSSDLEIVEKARDRHELGLEQERKLDRILAQQIFNDLDNSNKEQSEEDECIENNEKCKINRKRDPKSENVLESVGCLTA